MYTKAQIENMHYSQLVGLLKERNRPSGGIRTIQTVAVNSFLNSRSRALEIGSNTGFTSVNLSLLSSCRVVGIDVNKLSVEEARRYAAENKVSRRVQFRQCSAVRLPFKDNEFDLVWASNVTAFIDQKEQAVSEYLRVLRYNGYLAFIPIYYVRPPSARLLAEVGRAINSELTVWSKGGWIDLCLKTARKMDVSLELVAEKDYRYRDMSGEIQPYSEEMLAKPHIRKLVVPDAIPSLSRRYADMMGLFNRNLQYCGYSVLIFQKRVSMEERELFLTYDA